MPWVYLDDKFDQHPKVIEAGSEAAWMFVTSLCWSNRNLTAGRIPKSAIRLLTDKRPGPLVARLLEVVLWEPADDGYLIHDYEFWNKTAKSMSDKARNAAERRWERERQRDAQALPEHVPEHVPEQSVSNARARTRAPGPLSPSPSPCITSPTDSSGLTAVGEEIGSANGNGDHRAAQQLVDRLTSVVAAKGPKIRAEAHDVVRLCRQHVADQMLDEAIGYMAKLDDRPKHPQYLLGMIPKWAKQRGVDVPTLELPASA